MVDWAAARAFTELACAEIFDVTPCRLQPRRQGLTANHAENDDPDRQAFDFLGTIDLDPSGERLQRRRPSDPAVDGRNVVYDAILSAHVGGWPYFPRKGDHVLEGEGGPSGKAWKIADKIQDGSNRPAWYLTKL